MSSSHLSLRFQQPGAISLALFSSILPAQKSTRGCMSSDFSPWFSVSPWVTAALALCPGIKPQAAYNLRKLSQVLAIVVPRLSWCLWQNCNDRVFAKFSESFWLHAPRSRVFRFHYHHIPISWTETAQPCHRHLFYRSYRSVIVDASWPRSAPSQLPPSIATTGIVWAHLAILITNSSAPSRKPFLWAPCKAQAFLILEDKPWEY